MDFQRAFNTKGTKDTKGFFFSFVPLGVLGGEISFELHIAIRHFSTRAARRSIVNLKSPER